MHGKKHLANVGTEHQILNRENRVNEGERDTNVPSLTRTGDIVVHGQRSLSHGGAPKHGKCFLNYSTQFAVETVPFLIDSI